MHHFKTLQSITQHYKHYKTLQNTTKHYKTLQNITKHYKRRAGVESTVSESTVFGTLDCSVALCYGSVGCHLRYYRVDVRVTKKPGALLRRKKANQIVLLSPRIWGELDEKERSGNGVIEARYVFDPADIERVAERWSWQPCQASPSAARRPLAAVANSAPGLAGKDPKRQVLS